MGDLAGSSTEANLRTAFGMESEASHRFRYFSQQADVEGLPDVAAMLRAAADGKAGHAVGHLDFLIDCPDPLTGELLEETVQGLASAEAAARGRATDTYPGFAKVARDEGFTEIADWMESLAAAEAAQAERLAEARSRLVNGL
jgi:rubrerythrin